jgi:GAF domain-containing protein
MAHREEMIKRQRVLADFGELATRSEDLDEVLTEACRLVGRALGTDLAKVMEIEENERTLLVRAGCGWRPGIVGHVRLAMSEH